MRLLASSLFSLALLVSACADAPPASEATERAPAANPTEVGPAPALPSGPATPGAEARSPESIAAANAMWDTFQEALRTRDRDALARLVADTLNPHVSSPDGWVVSRDTPEHAALIDGLLEGDTRDALLAIRQLDHAAQFSAANYEVPQDDGRLVVGYGFEEVTPGDWRLVTTDSQWSR